MNPVEEFYCIRQNSGSGPVYTYRDAPFPVRLEVDTQAWRVCTDLAKRLERQIERSVDEPGS